MQVGYLSYGLLAALAIALLIAAFTDLRRRQIDNWLNAAITLGAPLFWFAMGLSLPEIGWQIGMDCDHVTLRGKGAYFFQAWFVLNRHIDPLRLIEVESVGD